MGVISAMDDILFTTEDEAIDCAKTDNELARRGPPTECKGNLLPPIASRLEYIKNYNKTMQASAGKDKTEQLAHMLRPYLFHRKAPERLQSLHPTTLREIAQRVNFIHEDKVLFLKTTYDAFRIIGTNVLVEDDNGDCLLLSLYHYVAPHEDPSDCFPVGMHLALLAPLLKHARDNPRNPLLLRCDNPECVRVFPCSKTWAAAKLGKPMPAPDVDHDPDDLREQGNHFFAQQKYEAASRMYSQALACTTTISETTRIACLGNRAEVHLRQERWEAAERDARDVLLLQPGHVKAQFRLTRALLHLNRILEAHELVSQLKQENDQKKNRELDELFLAVKQARMEHDTGNYNLRKMVQEVSCHGTTSFHANYTLPKIERGAVVVKTSGFSYRGCVARHFIPKKTLISATKALVFVPRSKERKVSFASNPYTRIVAESSRLEMENKTIVMLHRRPELKTVLYSLSSSQDEDSTSGNKPDMRLDVDRVIRIVSTNSFALESESIDDKPAWTSFLNPNGTASGQQLMMSSGLWVNESAFNHSCTPNCNWSVIGDHMFVRTTKDIQPGEELCFSYVDLEDTFATREKTFSNWLGSGMGFRCECDWCCTMRATPELRQAEHAIDFAYQNSVLKFLSHDFTTIASTINVLLPESVRAEYFELFSRFPLEIQHITAGNLWRMEGLCLKVIKDDMRWLLEATKRDAAIREAVYGILPPKKNN